MPVNKRKKYRNRRIAVAVVLIIIVISIAAIIDLIKKDDEYKSVGNNPPTDALTTSGNKTNTDKNKNVTPPITTFNEKDWSSPNPNATPEVTEKASFNATLFFPDENFINLVGEKSTLEYDYSMADDSDEVRAKKIKATLEALIKGHPDNPSRTVIPKDTAVLGAKVSRKNAEINLSEEFKTNQTNSTVSVRLSLGQIILTCAEFGVDTVTIKIHGKTVDSYPGDIDLSGPVFTADYVNLLGD